MTGNELRERIDRLGLPYVEAAPLLGLTISGLHHQMRGERPVTRQTELLLDRLEHERRGRPDPGRAQAAGRKAAAMRHR
jgi:hypothetical protein